MFVSTELKPISLSCASLFEVQNDTPAFDIGQLNSHSHKNVGVGILGKGLNDKM